MGSLYIGQSYDLFWTFGLIRPSVEQYLKMVDYSMFSLFLSLSLLFFFFFFSASL